MKKIIINVMLVVSFLFIYFLQVNLFSSFKIAGVMPNLFIIYVLFIGLFYNRLSGVIYGTIFGLLLDFYIGKKIGISAVMLGIVGLFGGIFDKNFSKESRFTIIIMSMVCTVFYEFGKYVLGYFIYKYSFELLAFINILFIECIYNIIIIIILYPLIRKFGYYIEEVCKGNKILTRYF